jgi:hypothetical protein
MKQPLDDLVREARGHLGKTEAEGVDWSAVDRGLFARIEREQREERGRFVAVRRWPGVVAAAAAAAAVFAWAAHDVREQDGGSLAMAGGEASEIGGRIVGVEGEGQVLIDGRVALRGATIRLGDVIEVQRGGAVIERSGKLTMRIEAGSRAAVTHTDGALVLALARGAVEAQVVPVPRGEAFAVDIDGSRVAVHGTHLRVARVGDRVTVDLNEGVVAVGNAPRVGSVIGSLVTAPAHAEFAAIDVAGSLAVSHEATGVRPPVALGPSVQPSPVATEAARGAPEAPLAAAAPLPAPNVPHPVAVHPDTRPSPVAVTPVAEPAPVATPDANPEQALRGAVRACMDQRPHVENVTVLVSTTLRLDLADDGTVRAARFDPPVAPDVNACAASAIYRTRFAHGGSASIPIDFSN